MGKSPAFAGLSPPKLFAQASWPYENRGALIDAEAVMTNRAYGWVTPDAVAATAEQYGVGYMVSSWAPAISYGNSVRREQFTDETMQAYLTDMTETRAARGYGWCYGNWFSFVGIGAAYPAIPFHYLHQDQQYATVYR